MRSVLIAPFLAATMAAVPVMAAPAEDLAAVSAHIRATATMRSDFTQTDRSGRRLTGTLLMKRPGHVRFDYQKSVPMLIVADGKSLNMIDYQVAQVQRWPIGNSPLSALLDSRLDIARYARLQPTADANVVSVEVRDPKRPEYGTITMVFLRNAAAPGGCRSTAGSRSMPRTTARRCACRTAATTCRSPTARSTGATRGARPAGAIDASGHSSTKRPRGPMNRAGLSIGSCR